MNLLYTGTNTDADEYPIYVDTDAAAYAVLVSLSVAFVTDSLKAAREWKDTPFCARCSAEEACENSGMCRPCELLTKDEERRDYEDMRDGDAFAADHAVGVL